MLPTQDGSFRLFRLFGIQVSVHWSWFLVALFEFTQRSSRYQNPFWNALEYLSLFVIVLLHEFGHSLACRQVGGQADQIVLWPLGGVAYVAPPQRPAPVLWSIAAGPLVNIILVPIIYGAAQLASRQGWLVSQPDAVIYLNDLFFINALLLVFNLMPVYPLDGGQILRSLLWFVIGPFRSLYIASILGFVGIAGLLAWAVIQKFIWTAVMAVFLFSGCLAAFKFARAALAHERAARASGLRPHENQDPG